ncbi:Geranylgeranyl transferase type-2 subunit alpha [Micractinium conductrix]|uniref:Geranylgeranyl transferase type-2 subunit alpha n=1 Tax=Micractinium conductrix TaxID=554055 RepID=A0A2P6VPK7_9CHLO|nr:Geranylgeranyl transferase type-2 subunit alpha [Micractinium conductrix]|eukprot:PSC76033.1 Geranylgeranyl transferase type-2 subunit alpha [Micractinium conductrix]
MHGRPRQKPGQADPEKAKAAATKAALFGQLSKEVLSRRSARRYDAESLALGAKLLELHPEVYTVWNYRREALGPVLAAGGEAAVAAVQAELALTERALHRNPKSYATWHHRRYLVAQGMCSLEHELALVCKLLEVDERNFHGWGYRCFVVQLMGTPAERELGYAAEKINQNFSNYSAWHCRTALLPALHGGGGAAEAALAAALAGARLGGEAAGEAAGVAAGEAAGGAAGEGAGEAGEAAGGVAGAPGDQPPVPQYGVQAPPVCTAAATSAVPKEALDKEFELVKQAFFTEPEDQSGWFYHRWLLGCSLARWEQARGGSRHGEERRAVLAVLAREQEMCQELLEVEHDSKWPLLTLTRLRELQQQVQHGGAATGGGDGGGGEGDADPELAEEIAEGYARLIELDPLRAGYYKDARDGRAHVVARPAAAHA